MITSRELHVELNGQIKKIKFGQADTSEELEKIYKLRFRIYSEKGYIDERQYPDGLEKDDYDVSGKCYYFIAQIENQLIGCIRLINDIPLPTEKYFKFQQPVMIKKISSDRRCELGRFIIIPLNKEKGEYLPRGLIMLFLLDTVCLFGISHNYQGGYSFIKKSLKNKFSRLKMPVQPVLEYKQNYPEDGVLYKYFNQPDDPVVPVYFTTQDFLDYTEKHIHNQWMFEFKNGVFILKNNFYTAFLKKLNIM